MEDVATGKVVVVAMTMEEALQTILLPTAKAMVAEGPKVIEFNARFGDPETEVILPRLENDLVDVIMNVLDGKKVELQWSKEEIVGVVLASQGYPEAYQKGYVIDGLDKLEKDTLIFHSGTDVVDGKFVTNGGRVLFVACKGETLEQAQKKVYREIGKVECDGLFYRRDIGERAVRFVTII